MKKISYFFWSVVGGLVFCFAMTVYTAVQHHRAEKALESAPPKINIPLPAEAPAPGQR